MPQVSSDGSTATITPKLEFLLVVRQFGIHRCFSQPRHRSGSWKLSVRCYERLGGAGCTQQSNCSCPSREGPLGTILQPEANHIPTERYINKFHPDGQKLWYTREFDILVVYACARDAIFGLPESGQFCAFD